MWQAVRLYEAIDSEGFYNGIIGEKFFEREEIGPPRVSMAMALADLVLRLPKSRKDNEHFALERVLPTR